MIDLRNDFSFQLTKKSTTLASYTSDFNLTMYLNGEEVGYMEFREYRDKNGQPEELEVLSVDINQEYRNLGFGQRLYKEFGTIYQRDYMGCPVARFFVNPIAEYAYRKAVSLGWIPDISLSEDKIDRSYSDDDKKLYKDLRNKLPDKYKGPEVE